MLHLIPQVAFYVSFGSQLFDIRISNVKRMFEQFKVVVK